MNRLSLSVSFFSMTKVASVTRFLVNSVGIDHDHGGTSLGLEARRLREAQHRRPPVSKGLDYLLATLAGSAIALNVSNSTL